jgi:hypothetical protein
VAYTYFSLQVCQKEAWEHHHKFECKSFLRISASNDIMVRGMLDTARCFLRLLHLRANDKISDSDWAELLSFLSAAVVERRGVAVIAQTSAQIGVKYTKTNLSVKRVLVLYHISAVFSANKNAYNSRSEHVECRLSSRFSKEVDVHGWLTCDGIQFFLENFNTGYRNAKH